MVALQVYEVIGGGEQMKVGSLELFNSEVVRFHRASGDRSNSIEKLDQMFAALYWLAAQTRIGDDLPSWEMICAEWLKRRAWMVRWI